MTKSGKKQRLLVVAGAGSAVDFGMPSVCCINEICKKAASSFFSLVHNPSINLYEYMYNEIELYWTIDVPKHFRKTPNFEDILYVLYMLACTYPTDRFTSALGAFIARRHFPEIVHIQSTTAAHGEVFRRLSKHLVDSLLDDFRSRCIQYSPNFADLERFFSTLCDKFQVAVVTTNYDDLIYRALPQSGRETGFDPLDGSFKPERILHRAAGWPCIIHLHGSVHFDMRPDESRFELHRIYWEHDLAQCQQNSIGRSTRRSTEGHEFPMSSIIAGYGKTEQIQHLPFRIYYSELDRLIYDSDMVLFLGYGFGDTHINEAFRDYRDSRNRRVVIIDRANDHTMTAGSREGCSVTASRAMDVFNTPAHQMRCLDKPPNNVKPFLDKMEFERSVQADRPLSLWYNGMLAACTNPLKVVNELRP